MNTPRSFDQVDLQPKHLLLKKIKLCELTRIKNVHTMLSVF
jgi:hypothetical protein